MMVGNDGNVLTFHEHDSRGRVRVAGARRMSCSRLLAALLVSAAVFTPSAAQIVETADPTQFSWSEDHRREPLTLDGFELTFSDEFDALRVTDESGPGPWFAPVHSDVGASKWDKPSSQSGVYTVANGELRIRATRAPDGVWHAGSIQTADKSGKGFAQQYGYFEARMRFPEKPGAWCAFWLKSQAEHWTPSMIRPEIDVVEWYGGDPKGHHQSVHLWPAGRQYTTPGRLAKHWGLSNYTGMAELTDHDWHTHGALINEQWVIMYVDRKEVARFPTLEEFKTPLYPLVSLTLYEQDLSKAVPPIDMLVDYVRIYALPAAPKPPADFTTR